MLGAGALGWPRGMGNTCIPVVDSCWCMAKPIQYCKVKKKKKARMMLIQDSILFSTFSKIHLNPQAHSLFMVIFQAHYKYSMVINLKVCPFSVLGSLPPIYISSLSIPLFKLFSYIRITLLNPKGFYFFPSIFKFLFSPTSLSEHVRFTKLQCSVFS